MTDQTPAQQMIGDFAPKLVELTDEAPSSSQNSRCETLTSHLARWLSACQPGALGWPG